jgi:hypothetical protein
LGRPGPIYLAFNHPYQADGLNFTLQAGAGLRIAATPDWFVLTGVYLHHLSSAGFNKPNPGINDVLFTLGVGRGLVQRPAIP